MSHRRDFALMPNDKTFMDRYGLPWETVEDGSKWILIHQFPTNHSGYNHKLVTAAILMAKGYPDCELDMVYFHPALARNDDKPICATDGTQIIDGKTFQQWSRHRTEDNPWNVKYDNLSTHVSLIEDWLEREFEK